MAKPGAKRVLSDDCLVTIDETEYAIHEGEWVDVLVFTTIAETRAFQEFRRISVELEALADDDDAVAERMTLINEHYDILCDGLAKRLVGWNWSDMSGKPLPAPDGTVGPLNNLTSGELYYLLSVTRGSNPSAEKNDSAGSQTTSSAIEPTPIPRQSATARNRTKAS